MKKGLYDLTDEELALLVTNMHKEMEKEDMKYITVGGVAVQAHILKLLHEKTGKTLVELTEYPDVRMQDYVRPTDDVDIAIDSNIERKEGEFNFANRIFGILRRMAIQEIFSPSEENILGYKLVREGVKRPVFEISTDGVVSDEKRISLNIGRNKKHLENLDSKFYDIFVDGGKVIEIPYNPQFTVTIRVIKPEHLFASKIAKYRPKDTMDIHNLADLMSEMGKPINFEEIEKLLSPQHRINYERFLGLAKLENPDHH